MEIRKKYKENTVEVKSLIIRNFSKEFLKKIYDIYSNKFMSIVEKTITFDKLFTEEFGGRRDYRRIGEGTNRFVCLLDNHIIKVAYNYLAYLDNLNELAMSKKWDKDGPLALAYESNGIILVSEYVSMIDKEDFLDSQVEVKKVLIQLESEINSLVNKSKNYHFILGDMGMSSKNYGNWGRRQNGKLVILDYGYLYKVSNIDWRDITECPYCGDRLEYKDDFTELECSRCSRTVKYTTLRNNLGYQKIVETINDILKTDKEGKFVNGIGHVDVYREEIIEIEEKEPEIDKEIQDKLTNTKSIFKDILYNAKNEHYSEYELEDILCDIQNNKDSYYPELYPMLLLSTKLTKYNADSYNEDFDEKYSDITNILYQEAKMECESTVDYDEYLSLMSEEDEIGFDENTNSTNMNLLNQLVEEHSDEIIESSLSDALREEFGIDDIFLADENEEIIDDLPDDYDFKELDQRISEKKEYEEKGDMAELKIYYDRIKNSLISIINDINDTDDFVTGDDLYNTLLNGELIDYDYSAEVNASNILGGWEPSKFAFPLYRHLLILHRYDGDETAEEYEARYRIDDKEVKIPEDMFDTDKNIDIVLDQILSRFEEDVRPSRFALSLSIKQDLTKYYKALDTYFENHNEIVPEIDYNHPDYYLELAKNNTELLKEMKEAKEEMIEELDIIDIDKELINNKIIYYYDYEKLLDPEEEDLLLSVRMVDIISLNGNVNDIMSDIKSAYYMLYGTCADNKMFDPIKYSSSYIMETIYNDKYRPKLKAKLVNKSSKEDSYVPILFTKDKYKVLNIEQKYEKEFKVTSDEANQLNDIVHKLNKHDLEYSINGKSKYNFKKTKDNYRYLMTEKEYQLYTEYVDNYGITAIRDKDKLYAKTLVKLMDNEYNLCDETYNLFMDIALYGINEALARRNLIINLLKKQGMNRLDFLKLID